MTDSIEDEVRLLGEWDWWQPETTDTLHAADVELDGDMETQGTGRTACGKTLRLAIPGVGTRMEAHRCAKCCQILGYPYGFGSPKNDERCRPLVEARLKAAAS